MKWLLLSGSAFFVALFALTTFVPPSAEIQREARKYFTAEEIERGQEFAFQRRLLFWTATFLQLGILAWLVFGGLGRKLADGCLALTRGRWLWAVLLVGGFCFMALEAVALPIGLARLEVLRAWDMTRRSVADWLWEHLLGVGVTASFKVVVLLGLYLLIRFFPRTWWLPADLGTMALGAGFALVLPIWIAPLFNTFTPLAETSWAYLQKPVEELARRGEVPISEILVMDASRQGSHTNAHFTGFGATRRIVLYDTLLRSPTKPTPPLAAHVTGPLGSPIEGPLLTASVIEAQQAMAQLEIESILAHEMGHWLHNHIVKGLLLAGAAALIGFFLLSRILIWLVNRPPLYLKSPHDPAGVPLIWLLMMVAMWLAAPVENAISRHFERQADQVSLELAGRPDVFINTEIRMARDNISNVTPNCWSIWFLATHPPAVERIRMAEEWSQGDQGTR